MSTQAETRFKQKVLKLLNELPDTWCFKNVSVSVAGIPDIIGCHRGYFFAWELKKNSKSKPTKLQAHVLEKIREAHGFSEVVHPDNLDEMLAKLRTRYTALPGARP